MKSHTPAIAVVIEAASAKIANNCYVKLKNFPAANCYAVVKQQVQ